MANRIHFDPPANLDERLERARVTLAFCETMYQIHAQSGEAWGADLLILKNMQRIALATLHQDYRLWDGG